MSKFDLPHLINFFDEKNRTRLNSSYILKEGDRICIEKKKIKVHSSENKHSVRIKRKGSNDRLLAAFKGAKKKLFSVNSDDLVTINLIRLRGQRAETHFELRKNKSFLCVDFQNNHLLLNHNRYQIKRFSGKIIKWNHLHY